jgi:hypothetical protein
MKNCPKRGQQQTFFQMRATILQQIQDDCPNKIVGANGYSPQTRTQSDSSKEGFTP